MILSIIDLGSNSIRMDIIKIYENSGEHEYVCRQRKLVKLSEGMGMDGNLQPPAIERTLTALAEFKEIMNSFGTDEVIAIATAAVRNAGNSQEICNKIKDEIGISIQVIRGEQEAEYDFLGVMSTIDIDDYLILDTGGGSTEIILVNDREPLSRTSLPIGAVNMTEQFFDYGESKSALSELSDFISSQLDKVGWLEDAVGLPIIGLGGSLYNLAVAQAEVLNPNTNLHGTVITSDVVKQTFDKLFNMSTNQREDLGIEQGRIDTIVCGIIPAVELINKIDSPEIIISTASLREGVLFEYLENI